MPLINCIECNHLISDSALRCPSCSGDPLGVSCELCRGRLRRSQGVTCTRSYSSMEDGFKSYEAIAHSDCIGRTYTIPASLACRDCGLLVREIGADTTPFALWSSRTEISCPRCGARNVLRAGAGDTPPSYSAIKEAKSGCFIATAVLDSEHEAQLSVLRRFRDQFLMVSAYGRTLVYVYCRLSPTLAAHLEKSRIAKAIVRRCVILPAAHLVRVLWFRSGVEKDAI